MHPLVTKTNKTRYSSELLAAFSDEDITLILFYAKPLSEGIFHISLAKLIFQALIQTN